MKGLALLLGLLQAALSLQLGLLNLRQPLLQTLLGTDLSLQR
jgi:hypothetical protein